MTWAPGGNLPALLAAARLLVARGHEVTMLASAETRAAERPGSMGADIREPIAAARPNHEAGEALETLTR